MNKGAMQVEKMKAEHTPGPWKVHEDGRSVYTDHTNPAGMFSIAQGFPGNPEAMDRANLTLAAQAPDLKQQRDDLLAELIEAKKLIDNYVDANKGDYGFTDETAAYNAMVRFNPKSIAPAQGRK